MSCNEPRLEVDENSACAVCLRTGFKSGLFHTGSSVSNLLSFIIESKSIDLRTLEEDGMLNASSGVLWSTVSKNLREFDTDVDELVGKRIRLVVGCMLEDVFSGVMTLMPVVLGESGEAIMGAGIVCRFNAGGVRSVLLEPTGVSCVELIIEEDDEGVVRPSNEKDGLVGLGFAI